MPRSTLSAQHNIAMNTPVSNGHDSDCRWYRMDKAKNAMEIMAQIIANLRYFVTLEQFSEKMYRLS